MRLALAQVATLVAMAEVEASRHGVTLVLDEREVCEPPAEPSAPRLNRKGRRAIAAINRRSERRALGRTLGGAR